MQQQRGRPRGASKGYRNRATKEEIDAMLASGYSGDKHDVARILGCHPEHVLKMARNGDIPGHKFGRMWRFPLPLIVKLLEGGSLG